jgi:hypothetical protein
MSLSFVRRGQDHRGGGFGQVLAREAVAYMEIEKDALGIGVEKLLVSSLRHAVIKVAFAAVELELKSAGSSDIADPRQNRRFQPNTHPRSL